MKLYSFDKEAAKIEADQLENLGNISVIYKKSISIVIVCSQIRIRWKFEITSITGNSKSEEPIFGSCHKLTSNCPWKKPLAIIKDCYHPQIKSCINIIHNT